MTSFVRIILGLFGLAIILFLGLHLFTPKSSDSANSSIGEKSPVGQLKENAELKSPGQPAPSGSQPSAPATAPAANQ